MFGIGMTELLVILAVALVIFGPQRLPELARSLGRALGEFRRASSDLRQHLDEAAEAARLEPTAEPQGPDAPPAPELHRPEAAAAASVEPAPAPQPPASAAPSSQPPPSPSPEPRAEEDAERSRE